MNPGFHFVPRTSYFELQKAVHFLPLTSYLLPQNKPTGQGTGLGLSLAYDIVKAHDGELKVNSVEGEGSEFIITLNSLA